ncbi:MAG: HAMP domain-containing sensor histidine kinase [Verrucomicrobiota bacterium]
MSTEPKASESIETPAVAWKDVVRFIRQVSHDLRNHLNVVELQIAYLGELQTGPEAKAEIKRLREMTFEISRLLQRLTTSLGHNQLQTMPYKMSDFLEDLQNKIETEYPEERGTIEWNCSLHDEMCQIDPQQLQQALIEIFANAFQHERGDGPISLNAEAKEDRLTLTFREPKTSFELSTENWAREPLRYGKKSHYGLGLHRARVILEAHGGNLDARHEGSSLITTIALPLQPSEA